MGEDFWSGEDWNSRATKRPERRISGRGMVLAMLAFGVLTTTSMWVYWTLHTGPFRPFQDAIAAAFPHSSPRVDGGQRKMHKGTPRILRVVMRVDFDPTTDAARGEQVVDSVEQIAGQYLDLSTYEDLELFLFQGVPEKDVRQQEFTRHLRSAAVSERSAAVSGKPEKSSQSADP
ncbi:MAG TPA: hypothetical protein VGP63_07080 [Planctomycetaceae bacterium]|jgi:hypothetical protein|nr:hypothetical protein [Planctomycetaceae bacterium]